MSIDFGGILDDLLDCLCDDNGGGELPDNESGNEWNYVYNWDATSTMEFNTTVEKVANFESNVTTTTTLDGHQSTFAVDLQAEGDQTATEFDAVAFADANYGYSTLSATGFAAAENFFI